MNATRTGVATGVLACLAVLLWILAGRSTTHSEANAVTHAAAAEGTPALPPAVAGMPPMPPTPPTPKPAPPAAEVVEICGAGKVPVAADDPDGLQYVAARAAPDGDRWIMALSAGSDLRAHAVALLLTNTDQSEALAGLASQNADPALYAIALNACDRSNAAPSAACAQISPQAWTQLDPDNAAAWLRAARGFKVAGDAAGERAALARAASAHRFEDYNLSLLAYSQASIPKDVGAAEWNYLAGTVVGIEAATGIPSHLEASKYCSRDAVADASVAGQCRAIADLLDARGSSLIDLVFAKSIGARAGWSKERVDRAANYLDALEAAEELAEPGIGASRWSCGGVLASNAYLRDMSNRGGEVPALRERLEQSGESVRELAQQHRQYMEKIMRQVQETTPDIEEAKSDAK